MNNSASAEFPFKTDNENNCLKRAETVEDTILSAIRLFLVTRRGSRLGNVIGSFIPELLLELVPVSTLSNLSSQLKEELTNQFPGVDFIDTNLTRDLSNGTVDLVVSIKFTISGKNNIVDLIVTLPSKFDAKYVQRENI